MFLQMNFYSKELGKATTVNVLIPEKCRSANRPYKTMWLLHGLTDDHTAWMRYTAIERYANEWGIAVVMPNADRSWYTNTAYGTKYFDFIANELPALLRDTFSGMSSAREDNIVAGLSMGGYGALKLALTCPEQYGACISLSGSLDVARRGRVYNLSEWQSIFGYEIKDASDLAGSEHDLFALAKANKENGKPFPKLYLWCGLEDTLVEVNRAFDAHLTSLDVPHAFQTSEGNHTWKWWDLHIQDGVNYVLNND